MQTLCEKYGGAENVATVVNTNIIGTIAADCRISTHFTSLDADTFTHVGECLTIQVQELFGCAGVEYSGAMSSVDRPCRPMAEAHDGLGISKGDFDALIEDVVTGLTEAGVETEDIMAAAPSDFRPAVAAPSKIKKGKKSPTITMAHTTDILQSTISKRKKGAIVVGFALETDDALAYGARKLKEKALDLIVVNDATEPGAGFSHDTNRVTLLGRGGSQEDLPLMSKDAVADAILDRVERLANGR